MEQVIDQAVELKKIDKQYIPFSDKLIHFASEYKTDELLKFIEKYLLKLK